MGQLLLRVTSLTTLGQACAGLGLCEVIHPPDCTQEPLRPCLGVCVCICMDVCA